MAGGPSALVKLGELLVQRASDAYSFSVLNFSAVPGWYSSFCNCHIETIPESLNFQFLRLMFLRICPYLLQDDRMGIWNAQKRVGHFIHPRKLWGSFLGQGLICLLQLMIVYHINIATKTLKPGAVKNRPLFKRVRTWIQIPSFFSIFQCFQSSGMSSMPVTLFPEDSFFLCQRLISLPKLILHWAVGRPKLNIIPPSDVRSIIKTSATSAPREHLDYRATFGRDDSWSGHLWRVVSRMIWGPPLAQPHSHTRVRKEKRKKSLFVILFCLAFLA